MAYCEPSNPREIWEEFRARLITDIRNRFRGRSELREDEQAEKYVLRETENYLQSMIGKTLVDFDLPSADPHLELLIQMSSDEQNVVDEEQARQELRANVEKFNDGQRECLIELSVRCYQMSRLRVSSGSLPLVKQGTRRMEASTEMEGSSS